MPVNDKIRVPDYNDIRTKIINVLGTGSGTSGYGQTTLSTAVDESNRITVNEWGRLRFDIINAYKHIFGVVPTIVLPTDGGRVRYSNTFVPDTGASDAPVTQFDTYCNQIIANRFTVHPSQSFLQASTSNSSSWPGIYGTSWNSRIQCTVTATFPSATAARHFFNSGGEIRIAASRSGGTVSGQNTAWTNILSGAGIRAFGGNLPSTGVSPLNGQNYYRCTNSYQVWYTTSGSTPYGSNSYRISARTPAVADNSTGTASVVEFLLEFIDNYTDPGPPAPGDLVDGTFTVSTSYLYAVGTLDPVGTGNFTVTQPVMTVGAISP